MANKVEFTQTIEKISIGQYYARNGCLYILSAASHATYQLTNIGTGYSYVGSVRVADKFNITPDEFRRICDGDLFVRVTSPITITPEA